MRAATHGQPHLRGEGGPAREQGGGQRPGGNRGRGSNCASAASGLWCWGRHWNLRSLPTTRPATRHAKRDRERRAQPGNACRGRPQTPGSDEACRGVALSGRIAVLTAPRRAAPAGGRGQRHLVAPALRGPPRLRDPLALVRGRQEGLQGRRGQVGASRAGRPSERAVAPPARGAGRLQGSLKGRLGACKGEVDGWGSVFV